VRELYSLVPLLLLLFLAPGCCGLFQPTEESVKAWATREIPVGTSRADAVRVIENHGLRVMKSDAEEVWGGVITGKCITDPTGYGLVLDVFLDSHQLVKETQVDKVFGFYDGAFPPWCVWLFGS